MDYQKLQQRMAALRVHAGQLPEDPSRPEVIRTKSRIMGIVNDVLDELNETGPGRVRFEVVESSSPGRLHAVPPPPDIPGPDPDDLRSVVVVVLPGREPAVLRA